MSVELPTLGRRARRLAHIDVLIPLLVIGAVALAALGCNGRTSAGGAGQAEPASAAQAVAEHAELPDPRLAGQWTGNAKVIVSWCEQEQLPVSLSIHADGRVSGQLGDAHLVDGRVSRNRGALGKALDIKTDFIIHGGLDGWLVAAEEIGREKVDIPFGLGSGVLAGAVHSSGWHVGPPSKMVFSATFDDLTRSVTDFAERTAALEPRRFGSIRNLTTLDGVYFGGQPTPEDIERADAAGLAGVLNLRPSGELSFDEAGVVTQLGMQYLNPAFASPEGLTDEVLDAAREQLRTAQRPLLFHCGSANRVGAVWLAHRIVDEGWSFDEALAEARAIGLRTPGYETRVREYAEARKP